MKFYSSIWFITALLLSIVSCSVLDKEESIRRSVRGREMLMDNNLRRFHTGSGPVHVQNPAQDYPQGNQLPQDLLIFLGSNMLSLNESNSLFSTNNYANQTRVQMINNRLFEFNEHYLFEEQWLNNLMYAIIKEHIPENMNLKSEGIHDYIELMTLKYIEQYHSYVSEAISRHLYHALMTFIHETVYGSGESVPFSKDSWLKYVAFKDKGLNLQRTFEYYYQTFGKDDVEKYSIEHPDVAETVKWRFRLVTPTIEAFEWNSEDDGFMSESEAYWCLMDFGQNEVYSERILDKIPLTDDIIQLMYDNIYVNYEMDNPSYNELQLLTDEKLESISLHLRYKGYGERKKQMFMRFRRFLYRKFGRQIEDQIGECEGYIDSCNLFHSFDIKKLQALHDFDPWLTFKLIVSKSMPYLIKMEMISKYTRSGILPLHNIHPDIKLSQFEALLMLFDGNLPFFELVLTEYPSPVNMEYFKLKNFCKVDRARKEFISTTQIPQNNL